MPFFILGVWLREHDIVERIYSKLNFIGVGSGLCLIMIALYEGYKNGRIDCVSNTFGLSILTFYMVASLLSIAFVMFFRLVLNREYKLIRIISDGTLLILSLHYVMISPLKAIFGQFNWGFIVITIIIMAICTLLILVFRKRLPLLIGKWK